METNLDLKIKEKIGDYNVLWSGSLIVYDNKVITLTINGVTPVKTIEIKLKFDEDSKDLKLTKEVKDENELMLIISNPGMSCYTIEPLPLLSGDNFKVDILFSFQRLGDNDKGWLFNYSFISK